MFPGVFIYTIIGNKVTGLNERNEILVMNVKHLQNNKKEQS